MSYSIESISVFDRQTIKLAKALNVSLDYLAGNINLQLDQTILNIITTIQKLPEEDKRCIMYSIDGLIQHAKN